jgi:hypothetical protein
MRKYPVFLNRYAIPFQRICGEFTRQKRPLRILEIGLGSGMMLSYTKTALSIFDAEYRNVIETWNGVDISPQYESLERCGYDTIIKADIEKLFSGDSFDFDICILLHIAEHLFNPEKTLGNLFSTGSPEAVFCIGYPAHFAFAQRFYEPRLRANPNANGHVSVISDRRIKKIAKGCGLNCLANQASFFLRASTSFLEDYAWWYRFNFLWGQYFPFWYSEHTTILQKTT